MTTPREQLAELIFMADNDDIPPHIVEGEWKTGNPEIVNYAHHIAQAIIDAGWTPPLPAPPTDTTLEN